MVRDELCVFMERNHSIGVHGAPPPRSSPPGLCNVNNLAGNLFLERSAHIPPTHAHENATNGHFQNYQSNPFVLTLFILKAPNYVLARTLTERVV